MAGTPPEWAPPGIDATRPSAARIHDVLLGGLENFAIDRMAADRLSQAVPQVAEMARLSRRLLRRVVRLLAERGVGQFLDLGAGLPTRENTHQMAPGLRVVYVDADPLVEPHARLKLRGNPDATAVTAD